MGIPGGAVQATNQLLLGATQFWDSLGDALTIGPACVAQLGNTLFGGNNAGYTLGIAPNASVAIVSTLPNEDVGTLGDFHFASAPLSSNARAFDEAAGAYTAPIATTWPLFAAATPAGFGGAAHDLTANSHLVASSF
jgi:hypothetical protein